MNDKQAVFEEHKELYAKYFRESYDTFGEYIESVNEANGTDYVVEADVSIVFVMLVTGARIDDPLF